MDPQSSKSSRKQLNCMFASKIVQDGKN